MAALLHILKRERVRLDYLSNRSTVDFSHRRTLVYLTAVASARLESTCHSSKDDGHSASL
jgi:hypothetical protein